MFPPECTKTVALYHLPTTAGATQSYPASADVTVSAAFLPLDRAAHTLEGIDLVEPYEVYFPPSTDVRVGDKAVIDSTNYYIKKVTNFTIGGLSHKRAQISRNSHA